MGMGTGMGTGTSISGNSSGGFPSGGFNEKSGSIVKRLMGDFGLSVIQAAGIVGNLGHESGGFKQMQEKGPIRGRGGFGWAQWTGPRRKAFEAWASQNNLDIKSDDANYGYLKKELQSSEKASITAVKNATTLEDAVKLFESKFERAGVKHYESRNKYAKIALDSYNKNGGGSPTGTESTQSGISGDVNASTPNSPVGVESSTSGMPSDMSGQSSGGGLSVGGSSSSSGVGGVSNPFGDISSAMSSSLSSIGGSGNNQTFLRSFDLNGNSSLNSNTMLSDSPNLNNMFNPQPIQKTPGVAMSSYENDDTKQVLDNSNKIRSGFGGFNDMNSISENSTSTTNETASNTNDFPISQMLNANTTPPDPKVDLGPTQIDSGSIDFIIDKLFNATGQLMMFSALTQATGQMPLGLDGGRS